jgi:hypothetical protein
VNATSHPIECEHCGARYSWPTPIENADVPRSWDELRQQRHCHRCKGLFTLGPILPPDNRAAIINGTAAMLVSLSIVVLLSQSPMFSLLVGAGFGMLVGGIARWRPGRPK